MENEVWKWAPGYVGKYAVSSLGRVWSEHSKRLLTPAPNYAGYLVVGLMKNKKPTQYRVHRLVAEAFLPNPAKLPCVNHINEDRKDNRLENLEWCTNEYNNNYGSHNARISERKRELPPDGYRVKVKKSDSLEWVDYKSIRQACEATGEIRTNIYRRRKKIGSNVVYVGGYIYWFFPGESLRCGTDLLALIRQEKK